MTETLFTPLRVTGRLVNDCTICGFEMVSDDSAVRAYVGGRDLAHLFSASPDLYEALEWLIKQIDEQCVCLEWGSPPSTLAEIIESRVDG
ncbi:MAG: hypothetical protein VX529_06715, partial [Pseudomonadota bacterium]|nr:hypothetical protein [Pseudomonadota bacterium]